MSTNMTGFRWFSKILHHCALDESSLSIIRVKSEAETMMLHMGTYRSFTLSPVGPVNL